MDRFEAMSMVLAVAKAGSLSAAARRQKTPLATVSRKVSDLEAHLETRLFQRSTRALVPTDAGRAYIAAAKRILADIEETERAAFGEYATPRGDLIISAPVALGRFYLQPVVTEFLAAYPEVDIHLSLVDRSVNLVEEHVDVALRLGTLADSGLIAVRIGETSRVICASPAYLRSRGTPMTPDDLASHDMISYPPLQSPGMWRFKQGDTHHAVPVRSRLIVSNLESACDAARAGIGITEAFAYLVAASIRSGELVALLQEFQPPAFAVSFVYSPNRYLPAKLRAFLDFTLPRLKARLSGLP